MFRVARIGIQGCLESWRTRIPEYCDIPDDAVVEEALPPDIMVNQDYTPTVSILFNYPYITRI